MNLIKTIDYYNRSFFLFLSECNMGIDYFINILEHKIHYNGLLFTFLRHFLDRAKKY